MTTPPRHKELSADDARILDMIAEQGFDESILETMDGTDRDRATAITDLLGLLEDYPVENASEELVDATVARIRRDENQRLERMRLPEPDSEERTQADLGGRRFHFPDLFATAAMLLLAVGVLWPIMNYARSGRLAMLDRANLNETGQNISLYASANNGSTPMEATAGILPDPFEWNGQHRGHYSQGVRNAMTGGDLIDNDYHCPETDPNLHPYSFQYWQNGDDLLESDRMLAANVSPVHAAQEQVSLEHVSHNSPCHLRQGQNVLYGDNSVRWIETWEIDGDRIWDIGLNDQGQLIEVLVGKKRISDRYFLIN
jgi:hypothetical protein